MENKISRKIEIGLVSLLFLLVGGVIGLAINTADADSTYGLDASIQKGLVVNTDGTGSPGLEVQNGNAVVSNGNISADSRMVGGYWKDGTPTENECYDNIGPAIPNNGDTIIISGGGSGGTNGDTIYFFSYAARENSSRIVLYGFEMDMTDDKNLGDEAYYFDCDDGTTGSAPDFINVSW